MTFEAFRGVCKRVDHKEGWNIIGAGTALRNVRHEITVFLRVSCAHYMGSSGINPIMSK